MHYSASTGEKLGKTLSMRIPYIYNANHTQVACYFLARENLHSKRNAMTT